MRSPIISPASAAVDAETRVATFMYAEARVAAYDWQALAGELASYGCAVLLNLLRAEECRAIADLYPDEGRFRSHIDVAPSFYPAAIGVWRSTLPSWAVMTAVRGAEPSV
jgi:hypothetical protein